MPWWARTTVQHLRALWAIRPQLTRGPLGGPEYTPPQAFNVLPPLVLGLATVMAAAGLTYYVWSIFQGLAAQRWPIAHGEIATATIDEGGLLGRPQRVIAAVTYAYQVNLIAYRGKRIIFGRPPLKTRMGRGAAESVTRYAVGRPVEVPYHPKKPSRAVLEPGVTFQTYIVTGFMALVVVVGLVQLAPLLK